jgi:multiple sugar transport system ATP-binding protein
MNVDLNGVDIVFDGVQKTFPDGTVAVEDFNLTVDPGEFLVLVGPSGCGKTTLLRMVAGLETASRGVIRIAGRDVTRIDPAHRDVAMIFQTYALYPNMTVADNIGFGLRMRKVEKPRIRSEVGRISTMLGLSRHLARKPAELSGGQRQRVATGRAVIRQPKAFLMDEPLSNLDAKLRVQMRAELAHLQAELGITTIYVTHDQIEAMTMGDRVTVMRHGRIEQVGAPEEVYGRPENLFVASFMGSPPMNLMVAEIEMRDNAPVCQLAGGAEIVIPARSELSRYDGRSVAVGIRPERIRQDGNAELGRSSAVPGSVLHLEALGSDKLVYIEIDAPPVLASDVREGTEEEEGALLGDVQKAIVVARFDPDFRATAGERLILAFDADSLHFFDLESGDAIWPRAR